MSNKFKCIGAAWASGWILPFAIMRFIAGGEDWPRGLVSVVVCLFFLTMSIGFSKEIRNRRDRMTRLTIDITPTTCRKGHIHQMDGRN